MKKIIVLMTIVCMMMTFSSCAKSLEKAEEKTEKVSKTNVDVSAFVESKEKSKSVNMGSLSLSTPYKNDAEKFAVDGSVVVHGKVLKTNYVMYGSTAYTRSEVEVTNCFKGDIEPGSTIVVREMGGLVPEKVYCDAINLEKYGKIDDTKTYSNELLDLRINGFKPMEKDEEVILFLVSMPTGAQNKEFDSNSYDLLRVWQGKLLYNDEQKLFIPYIPSDELAATKDSANIIEAKAYTLKEFSDFAKSIEK